MLAAVKYSSYFNCIAMDTVNDLIMPFYQEAVFLIAMIQEFFYRSDFGNEFGE